jgi:hypothetical protein
MQTKVNPVTYQIVIYKHNLFAYPRSFRQTVNVCYTSLFTMAEQYRNPIEKNRRKR